MRMTMMNRLLLTTVLLLLASLTLKAQKTDFGLWYEVNAEYGIVKGLRFDFEANVRTDQNASKVEKFYFEPGLRYKFNDYFAAGIYYRFTEQRETIDKSEGIYEFHPRHRWFVQLKGSLPVYRFTLSARYRFQEQFKTYIEDPEDEIPVWAHRLRMELSYDIKGFPLKPYASVEMASELFASNEIMIEQWRYIVGADYTVNKKHTFGLEYIYNVSKDSKPAYLNAVGLKYKIKL
jgi:long-subunit fatty acid transport protein